MGGNIYDEYPWYSCILKHIITIYTENNFLKSKEGCHHYFTQQDMWRFYEFHLLKVSLILITMDKDNQNYFLREKKKEECSSVSAALRNCLLCRILSAFSALSHSIHHLLSE